MRNANLLHCRPNAAKVATAIMFNLNLRSFLLDNLCAFAVYLCLRISEFSWISVGSAARPTRVCGALRESQSQPNSASPKTTLAEFNSRREFLEQVSLLK